MYKDVLFSIKLPDCITETSNSSIGVKQGCILIPVLFSLYINDLGNNLDSTCDPVYVNDREFSCLMYADDLVLLSQSYEGLQSLLERLKSFCDTWNLKVNVDKTKIMIFNKSGKILKRFSFRYENQNIEITNEHKYLGIIFKLSGTFSYATSHLFKKASKAMFCIRKSLFSDRINLVSHLKLVEACVKPILLYW
jgi:hypothetical protein